MPIQKCPLCLETKPVVSSHLMPAATYGNCTPPGGHPIAITSKIIMESDRQLQDHLLCGDCEESLNEGGENWLMPLLARIDGTFPFYDILVTVQPDWVIDGGQVYAAVRNPLIEADKLIHVAMGIFFKTAVHSWSGSETEPRIALGPYTDEVRTFLRGETGFPKRMSLTVGVLPAPVKDISHFHPYRDTTPGKFNYRFYMCGIIFILAVGKGVTAEDRRMCFATNSHHPIFVTDFTNGLKMVFGEAFRKARKAKNVEKWLKR
jgi:hypothetical protein